MNSLSIGKKQQTIIPKIRQKRYCAPLWWSNVWPFGIKILFDGACKQSRPQLQPTVCCCCILECRKHQQQPLRILGNLSGSWLSAVHARRGALDNGSKWRFAGWRDFHKFYVWRIGAGDEAMWYLEHRSIDQLLDHGFQSKKDYPRIFER